MFKALIPGALIMAMLAACSQEATPPAEVSTQAVKPTAAAPAPVVKDVFASQSEEVQARYVYRHPQETLEFFGIEPGMTVAEALPGGGWYSKILLPLLGGEGKLIGIDYALDMFPKFGFFSAERIEAKKTWTTTWTADANSWRTDDSAVVSAFVFGSMPEESKGVADAFLFIRALHNLNRFEGDGGYLTAALRDAYDVLKPGGIVGVVQHMAAEDKADDWADGSKGYLKKSLVIKKFEEAGFEFVASSDVNLNPDDQPGDEDIVWRLPPTLATSRDNPELRQQMLAVGESNRMTLKFRKVER
jgi:predicted methyltransferase